MVGSDGELLINPFKHIPIYMWTWDFESTFNLKRHIDNIEREILFKGENYPKPTRRTKMSEQGFEEWKDWIKRQEDKKKNKPPPQDPDKPTPREKWEMYIPGHIVTFDYLSPEYIVYENILSGKLVTFNEVTIANPQVLRDVRMN